jgi:hypothetical protein
VISRDRSGDAQRSASDLDEVRLAIRAAQTDEHRFPGDAEVCGKSQRAQVEPRLDRDEPRANGGSAGRGHFRSLPQATIDRIGQLESIPVMGRVSRAFLDWIAAHIDRLDRESQILRTCQLEEGWEQSR